MRRSVSPRFVVKHAASELRQILEVHPNGKDAIQDVILAKLDAFEAVAIDFAKAAPPDNSSKYLQSLERASAEALERAVSVWIERELSIAAPEAINARAVAKDCLAGIKKLDSQGSIDEQLAELSASLNKQHGVEAPDWHAELLETVMRESLGLEGEPPHPNAGASVSNVQRLLQRIQAPQPHPAPAL